MTISSASNISVEAPSLPSSQHPNPLATVVSWELRRLRAARSTWIIVLLVFVLSCLIEWALRSADQYTISFAFGLRTFWIDWGSNYGLFNTLPQVPGIVLGLYLPFLCTDGVARDLKRRSHELLMTTATPSWAYVWGRYLSCLLASLALACLMLMALIFVALIRHQIQPDIYLVPDPRGLAILWALIVLPPTILISSISFALGTLWPQISTIIKVALLVGWFLMGQITARMIASVASCQQCALNKKPGLAIWDPTSLALSFSQSTNSFLKQLALQTHTQNTQLFLASLHTLEQQLPDMSTWIIPRLIWIVIGIAFVMLASLFFRRFRNVYS